MKYVVLGASASGISAVKELRRLNPKDEIVMISKDKKIYSRCILHFVLSGRSTEEEINFVGEDFCEKNNIDWIKGVAVTQLDTDKKIVKLSDNREVSYDKILIATGANPFIPKSCEFETTKNIYGLRNIEDVNAIKEILKTAKNPVIIGGGLVALDAVVGVIEFGFKKLHLVEMADRLLFRQLDKKASLVYEKELEKHGVNLHLNTKLEKIGKDSEGKISKLFLENGEEIHCDLLIIGAGIKPNIEFLKNSNVEVSKEGLEIDDFGRTNVEDVYGSGDVTGKYPIWPIAVKEGMIAASNMSGIKIKMTDFFASKATMNFFGINTLSLGINEKPDDSYEEVIQEKDGIYKKIIHKDGKIYGAISQGDLSYSGVLTQLISNKIDISKVKKSLFEISYSDFFNVSDNFEFYYEEK